MFKDELNNKYLTKTPEGFVNGLYGHKTDIWAFGAILYGLLMENSLNLLFCMKTMLLVLLLNKITMCL